MAYDENLWEDPMLRGLEHELAQPFASESISWRVGSTNREKTKGMALAYMDARDVMERLDGILGVSGWQCRYTTTGNGKTCCEIGLRLEGEWIWKSDGAGDTDVEGDKGAFSDAFKRAAVRWGIGRYLYNLNSPWMPIEQRGRSYAFTNEAKQQLIEIHDKQSANVGMSTPSERASVKVLAQTIRSICKTANDVDAYVEANRGVLQQLRRAQQEHIKAVLAHIRNGAG